MITQRCWMIAAGLVLAAQLMFAGQAAAQDGIDCNPDGNQLELNACAFADFKKADAALHVIWKKLLAALDGDAGAIKQTRAAQRAWITFRDAEVTAHFPLEGDEDPRVMYGSMYPMSMHGVMTALTEQRTEQLRARLVELDAH